MLPPQRPGPFRPGGQRNIRFDPDSEQYLCCCGSVHCLRGARIIGGLETACLVLSLALIIAFYSSYNVTSHGFELLVSVGALATGIVLIIFSLLIIACLFLAIEYENHTMLWPHLIGQAFSLLGMLFAFVVSLVILIGYRGAPFGYVVQNLISRNEEDNPRLIDPAAGKIVGSVVNVFSLVGFILQLWFMSVIYALYRFYKDKNKV